MAVVSVCVQKDHLQSLFGSRNPSQAIPELIWNSLDADASEVSVDFKTNAMNGLESIAVRDTGHGLAHQDAQHAFGDLGDSWKKSNERTRGKRRFLHGRGGKGRFRAFALGGFVQWTTRYADDGSVYEYRISGREDNPGVFEIEDTPRKTRKSVGTDLVISEVYDDLTNPRTEGVVTEIAEQFALYLTQYPDISVRYDEKKFNPRDLAEDYRDYDLGHITLPDGRTAVAVLTIIQWKSPKKRRALFLCDAGGFSLSELPAGIQAPGFQFTAYLKSDICRELADSHVFDLQELHPSVRALVDCAKDKLRTHFRERVAIAANTLVDEWKAENIYPYQGPPRSIVDEVERQVFDVLALNVHEYLPDFGDSDARNKRLSFQLLRHALETNPEAVGQILRTVLELPKEKQDELAKLLEKTTLAAIINASKMVAGRLDFLRGIQLLVFDNKKETLERRQLHRILADHTWIFGEQFNLTADDEDLTNVLRKHLANRADQIEFHSDPVLRDDGSKGIVDLMLSRRIPQSQPEKREHLIVELKRPSKRIDGEVLQQIKSYAFAIWGDERFKDTDTRWLFWAISDDWTEAVRAEALEQDGPSGRVLNIKGGQYSIWVKTWGQVIQECEGRLKFIQEKLEYSADKVSALRYLRETHEKYLPSALREHVAPGAEKHDSMPQPEALASP